MTSLVMIAALCVALFLGTCTGAPTHRHPDATDKDVASEYTIPVGEVSGVRLQERITIDTHAQTELFSVPSYRGSDEGDIMQDFHKKLTMIRVPRQGACYLALQVSGLPPKTLQAWLDKTKQGNQTSQVSSNVTMVTKTSYWKVDVPLLDRQILSEEMAALCARYPVYWIQRDNNKQSRNADISRQRRSACWTWVCRSVAWCKIVRCNNGKYCLVCKKCWYIQC